MSRTQNNQLRDLQTVEVSRLPYHAVFKERYGVDEATWRALIDGVWPSAKSINSVMLALSYCKARGLDPLKKPIHIVPVWSSEHNRMVETIWPGIGEYRTTAHRTGGYAGMDPVEFGPEITRTFEGRVKGSGGNWKDTAATVTFPEWAQITVYRMIGGARCAFPGPRVYWLEHFAQQQQSGVPNSMWERRPHGQLEKCAEAQSLRRAFPEEISSDATAEEMEGQTVARASGAFIDTDDGVAISTPKRAPSHPDRSSGAEDVDTDADVEAQIEELARGFESIADEQAVHARIAEIERRLREKGWLKHLPIVRQAAMTRIAELTMKDGTSTATTTPQGGTDTAKRETNPNPKPSTGQGAESKPSPMDALAAFEAEIDTLETAAAVQERLDTALQALTPLEARTIVDDYHLAAKAKLQALGVNDLKTKGDYTFCKQGRRADA